MSSVKLRRFLRWLGVTKIENAKLFYAGGVFYGETPDTFAIKLSTMYSHRERVLTLFHEAMHLVLRKCGIEPKNNHHTHEGVCECGAYLMAALFAPRLLCSVGVYKEAVLQ